MPLAGLGLSLILKGPPECIHVHIYIYIYIYIYIPRVPERSWGWMLAGEGDSPESFRFGPVGRLGKRFGGFWGQ